MWIEVEHETVEPRVAQAESPYFLNVPPRAFCRQAQRVAGKEIYVRDGECPAEFPDLHKCRREGNNRHAKYEYSFRFQGGTDIAQKAMGRLDMFEQVTAINGVVGFFNWKFLFRVSDEYIEPAPHTLRRVLGSDSDPGAPGAEVRQVLSEGTSDIEHRFFVKPEGRNDIAERPGFRNGLKPSVYGFCFGAGHLYSIEARSGSCRHRTIENRLLLSRSCRRIRCILYL